MTSVITYSVADKMVKLLKKYNVQVLELADNNLHSSVLSSALLPSAHQTSQSVAVHCNTLIHTKVKTASSYRVSLYPRYF